MSEPRVEVSVHGSFFRTPIVSMLHSEMREVVQEVVDAGEREVVLNLHTAIYAHGGAHPDRYTVSGHARRMVSGDVVDSLHGRVHWNSLIYGPWLEGVGSRNATTRFKGYFVFRQATTKLRVKSAQILRRHVSIIVRKLNQP